jgi:guanosine-3',5'-bis(diphosphate) 3'-pyrophosphohydrolase
VILLFKSVVHVAGHMRGGVFVSPHVRRADSYADKAHTGQYRNGKPGATKVPYIEHPRAVARILHEEAGITDPVTLQAALLHDTMEDTGVTHANLVAEFGHDVADLVAELTNPADFGPGGKTAWQAAHAKKMSARAAQVKTADKTANLRDLVNSPPDWPTERRRKYFEDARQVVQAIGQPHPVLSKLFESTFLSGLGKL